MPVGLLFWILMVAWLILGAGFGWRGEGNGPYLLGGNLLLWVLLALLGWHVFGKMLQ